MFGVEEEELGGGELVVGWHVRLWVVHEAGLISRGLGEVVRGLQK